MHRPFTRRNPAAQARRTVVLRPHTPFTCCIPGPHASRTNVNISAGCWGTNGIPSVEEARANPKGNCDQSAHLSLLGHSEKENAKLAAIGEASMLHRGSLSIQ